ncbi:hypothetical protein [Polynucleobacter necessarius]|uniref:hypothetical protein n=1 Tax=Polynucleobacter necessarius TaxID=576610 RepID=UPI000FE20B65|nr:hypothetical protein [Polynucleobacter necessarius]
MFSGNPVKVSAAVFALMSIIIVLPALVKDFHQNKKIYLNSFLLGGSLVGVHLLRGFLNSGLAIYPSTLGAMWDLDWAVSYEQVKNEADWIYSWARTPNKIPSEVLDSWAWFPDWGVRLLKEHWRYVYGCLILTALNLMALLFKKQRVEKDLYVLYVPLLAGMLFWFITASNWRFFGAIPQLYVALSGFILVRYFTPTGVARYIERLPVYLIPLFFGAIVLLLMIQKADLKNLPFQRSKLRRR